MAGETGYGGSTPEFFLGFFRNPRMIMTFLFSLILCFFLSDKAMMVAEYYNAPMQAAEPLSGRSGIRLRFC